MGFLGIFEKFQSDKFVLNTRHEASSSQKAKQTKICKIQNTEYGSGGRSSKFKTLSTDSAEIADAMPARQLSVE